LCGTPTSRCNLSADTPSVGPVVVVVIVIVIVALLLYIREKELRQGHHSPLALLHACIMRYGEKKKREKKKEKEEEEGEE